MARPEKIRLGGILVKQGLLTEEQLNAAVAGTAGVRRTHIKQLTP
jgi:hypothetical protein